MLGAGARRASGRAAGRDAGVGAQGRAGRGSRRVNMAWKHGWRRQGRAGRPAGRAGWVSWAKLVHCAPGSVLTQFLDPVRLGIFPSH